MMPLSMSDWKAIHSDCSRAETRQLIRPEQLQPMPTEVTLVRDMKKTTGAMAVRTVQRFRDLTKKVVAPDGTGYVIIALQNQAAVDHGMPLRVMMEDTNRLIFVLTNRQEYYEEFIKKGEKPDMCQALRLVWKNRSCIVIMGMSGKNTDMDFVLQDGGANCF